MNLAETVVAGLALTTAAWRSGLRFEMANGRTVRQGGSNIDTLSDAQGIFEFYTKVAHCTVDLGVIKQQLYYASRYP